MHHSTGFDQIATALNSACKQSKSMHEENNDAAQNWEKYVPYFIFGVSDGSPNHNIKFLRNQMEFFTLFLLPDVDMLLWLRGYPSLLCINIVERVTSLINIGLSNVAISIFK